MEYYRLSTVRVMSILAIVLFCCKAGLLKGYWPTFTLAESGAFRAIAECSDIHTPSYCYSLHQVRLNSEFSKHKSHASSFLLKSCLDSVNRTSNDIMFLLDMQTCFHQSELIEISNGKKTTRDTWAYGIVVVLVVLQLGGAASFRRISMIHQGPENPSLKSMTIQENRQMGEVTKVNTAPHQSVDYNAKSLGYSKASNFPCDKDSAARKLLGDSNKNSMVDSHNCEKNSKNGAIGGEVKKRCAQEIKPFVKTPKASLISLTCGDIPDVIGESVEQHVGIKSVVPPIQRSPSCISRRVHEIGNFTVDSSVSKKVSREVSQKEPDLIEPFSHSTETRDRKENFDISTAQGRSDFKLYLKNSVGISIPYSAPMNVSRQWYNYGSASSGGIIFSGSRTALQPSSLSITYGELKKRDNYKKRYQRIYVPGRGWVSSKKLAYEEAVYGPDSPVRPKVS